MKDDKDSDSIDLLDIVFTAVLTIGLTPEMLDRKGMLSEAWARSATTGTSVAISPDECLHALTFLVGISTLLLSWFGIRTYR